MFGIRMDSISGNEDHFLFTDFLDRFSDLHNGDDLITRKEARSLFDRNGDSVIDVTDWMQIASRDYLLHQQAFKRLVDIVRPLLWPLNIELDLPEPISKNGKDVLFKTTCDVDTALAILEESDPALNKLTATPKADLHIHFGGNASARFLFIEAIRQVGTGAIAPDEQTGPLNWDSDPHYRDYHTFKYYSLDEVIGMAKKEELGDEYIAPSEIVAEAQAWFRANPEVKLDEANIDAYPELSALFAQFEKLVTYKPSGEIANLPDFLNVYRVCSALAETTQSDEVRARAIRSAMYTCSEQGTSYIEMKIGAPKVKLAMRSYPDLEPEEAIYKMAEELYGAVIATIQKTNDELIADAKNPVDFRIMYTLSKGASYKTENLIQTQVLVKLLEAHPDWAHWIVGLDGAAKEPGEPPAIYEAHLQEILAYNETVPTERQLGITWHQGEDFSDTSLMDSIKRVDDLTELGVSRIGHGIVLGANPELYYSKRFTMSIDDYRELLQYDQENGFNTPINLYVDHASPNIEEELQRIEDLINGEEDFSDIEGIYGADQTREEFTAAIQERQSYVLARLKARGISIEVNPTSNLYMGIPSSSMEDHPLPYFVNQGVVATINTDDAGIFATDINREYASAAYMLDANESELSGIIANGFNESFAHKIRGENLDHLR
jgi:hypothetical protein